MYHLQIWVLGVVNLAQLQSCFARLFDIVVVFVCFFASFLKNFFLPIVYSFEFKQKSE